MDSDDQAERIAQYEKRVREIRSLAQTSQDSGAQEALMRLATFYESMISNIREWDAPLEERDKRDPALRDSEY